MSTNFNPVETALRVVCGKTYPLEFECDVVCSEFTLNSVRYEVMDNVLTKAQHGCAWSLNETLCVKIREYSF